MTTYLNFGKIQIKICCITSIDEANLAIQQGARLLGLVSQMPSGPGVISDEQIGEIAGHIPPGVTSVLLTSKTSATDIIAQHRVCRTNAMQLCDRLSEEALQTLRSELPGIGLIQVIHVSDPDDVEAAIRVAPMVDALLLDTGSRSETLVELGGTGRTHDWSLSKMIRESVNIPVFLAGGLNAGNVAAAIRMVQPFAVDVCSGVRSDDRLDAKKLRAFMQSVNR